MNRSGSQKVLLVISVINIVLGSLAMLLALMSGISGTIVSVATPETLMQIGASTSDQTAAANGFNAITFIAVVGGIIALVEGILGFRAAYDNQMIMPVWILAIAGIVFAVVSIIVSIVLGGFQVSSLFSLAGPCLMFWIANNIKRQAGK